MGAGWEGGARGRARAEEQIKVDRIKKRRRKENASATRNYSLPVK